MSSMDEAKGTEMVAVTEEGVRPAGKWETKSNIAES